MENAMEMKAALEEILVGLEISETKGGFIITGETYQNRDFLKFIGARWNAEKKVWKITTAALKKYLDKTAERKAAEEKAAAEETRKAAISAALDELENAGAKFDRIGLLLDAKHGVWYADEIENIDAETLSEIAAKIGVEIEK